MNNPNLSPGWFARLYEEFRIRYYFKYVLPKLNEAVLEGVRLDLSTLPLKQRNRILNGGYEAHELRFCREFLNPADSVLELGGAIGFIGLYCQKQLGIKEYVTFEANPRTIELLKRNYQLNGLDPVVWNMALAPADGCVKLNVEGEFWENRLLPEDGPGGEDGLLEVPGGTLESVLAKANRPANVMIIDIEGAERFIDFTRIPPGIRKIIMEFHPHLIGLETMYNQIAALISAGFRVAGEEQGTFVFLKQST